MIVTVIMSMVVAMPMIVLVFVAMIMSARIALAVRMVVIVVAMFMVMILLAHGHGWIEDVVVMMLAGGADGELPHLQANQTEQDRAADEDGDLNPGNQHGQRAAGAGSWVLPEVESDHDRTKAERHDYGADALKQLTVFVHGRTP